MKGQPQHDMFLTHDLWFAFTPGAGAGALLHTNGQIMGYSGLIRSYMNPADAPQWKFALLGSFLATVQLYLMKYPDAAAPNPAADVPTNTAMILGGLLVGLGTKLSNGCTSGHGICGLARFSKRSLVAVLSFMTVGVATSVLISSTPAIKNEMRTSGSPEFNPSIGLAATAVTAGLALAARPTKLVFGAIVSGVLGALGLVIGGMVNTSKVIGFLDVSRLSKGNSYDPTLMMVMGAGVVVSTLAYLMVKRSKPPLFASSWSIPSNTTIDKRLVLGAAFFGIGWALTGTCPGPALWQVGAGSILHALYFMPCFFLGSYVAETSFVNKLV